MLIPSHYILFIYNRIFRAESIELSKQKLYDTGWSEIIVSQKTEKLYKMFLQFFIILCDQSFPEKKNQSHEERNVRSLDNFKHKKSSKHKLQLYKKFFRKKMTCQK